MRMKLASGIGFSACLLVGACASEPTPRPVRLDPANPAAAESPALAVGSLAGGGPALETSPRAAEPAPAAAHDEHQHGGSNEKATTYTCPMDADVVSDKPGRCPKCGMNLVPKTEAPPPPKGEKGKK